MWSPLAYRTSRCRSSRTQRAMAGSDLESATAQRPVSVRGRGPAGYYGHDRANGRVQGLVLPEPDHGPARRAERGVGGPVALHIAAQLRFPVPGIGRWLAAVLRAAVPEAPVDEHRDPLGCEHDVRPH